MLRVMLDKDCNGIVRTWLHIGGGVWLQIA